MCFLRKEEKDGDFQIKYAKKSKALTAMKTEYLTESSGNFSIFSHCSFAPSSSKNFEYNL